MNEVDRGERVLGIASRATRGWSRHRERASREFAGRPEAPATGGHPFATRRENAVSLGEARPGSPGPPVPRRP